MHRFELDLAYTPEEVAAGLERLFAKRGWAWMRTPAAPGLYVFQLTTADGAANLQIQPLPPERITTGLFPRTLLALRSESAAFESLRREIVLAFLRVMG